MSRVKSLLVDTEIQTILQKETVKIIDSSQDEFELHLFCRKERFNAEPSHQSENLEPAYLLRTFQNGGIISFKKAIKRSRFSMQGRLERCILRCSIARRITELCVLSGKANYQFVCLCFDLATAPLVFTKLMKIPIAVIRRLNGRIIIYLDNILIMARTREELLISRGTLIFLLQNLGFVINFKKSVLDPCQMLEFLGLEVDSLNRRVEIPKDKVEKIKKQCQSLPSLEKVSVRDLAKLTGRLSSMEMSILPVHYRGPQQQQITGLSMRGLYQDTIVLHKGKKMELGWWVQNLDLNNGR